MVFDIQWLLLAVPLAFGLGWTASRMDLRQWRQRHTEQPQAYFKGLSLLLNEQQDKAIDAFIEAVQDDPEAVELHFALGNLFRRRGEFERAIRVHEHLLDRADLSAADRDRAQYALAQDFFRAGLFDRAEAAFQPLTQDSAYRIESLTALLSLHERAHDWSEAIAIAQQLAQAQQGDFSQRIAHYHCERAEGLWKQGETEAAFAALDQARATRPAFPRAAMLQGLWQRQQGQAMQALDTWEALLVDQPQAFALIAKDYTQTALEAGEGLRARQALQAHDASDDNRLLRAQAELAQAASTDVEAGDAGQVSAQIWARHLARHPSLTAADELLKLSPRQWDDATWQGLQKAVNQAAQPLQRYRCAACGFEARHYFWQCPGCLGWDTFPKRTVEDL
jgi:lipopolysaccharide assembly protein B